MISSFPAASNGDPPVGVMTCRWSHAVYRAAAAEGHSPLGQGSMLIILCPSLRISESLSDRFTESPALRLFALAGLLHPECSPGGGFVLERAGGWPRTSYLHRFQLR